MHGTPLLSAKGNHDQDYTPEDTTDAAVQSKPPSLPQCVVSFSLPSTGRNSTGGSADLLMSRGSQYFVPPSIQ